MEKLADHPLVRFLIIGVLVLILVFACGNASAEELPDTLRTKGKIVLNAPCEYKGQPFHCFLVEFKGVSYVVITKWHENQYHPLFVLTKEKEVWNYKSLKI